MTTAHKIYAAAAVLAVGGGGIYLWRRAERTEAALSAAAVTADAEALPAIALGKDDAARITKIELTSPDDDDKSRLQTIAIERAGRDWEMTVPIKTQASTSKVEALIDNLQTLHLWKVIDPGTGLYDQYDLTDEKALHIVAWTGRQIVVDLFCGKSSAEGQLVRLPGRAGIFALVNFGPQGYSGFLYTRDLRSWRETAIFQFAEDDVVELEITNRSGALRLSKNGDHWIGSRTKRQGNGRLGRPERVWTGFDQSKVDDLLRVLKALSADDFGDESDRASSGVDEAEKTGGVIRIKLRNAAVDLTLRVGKPAKSTTRYAIKDSRWAIKDGGDGTLYALSPWTSGWALADASKFVGSR